MEKPKAREPNPGTIELNELIQAAELVHGMIQFPTSTRIHRLLDNGAEPNWAVALEGEQEPLNAHERAALRGEPLRQQIARLCSVVAASKKRNVEFRG